MYAGLLQIYCTLHDHLSSVSCTLYSTESTDVQYWTDKYGVEMPAFVYIQYLISHYKVVCRVHTIVAEVLIGLLAVIMTRRETPLKDHPRPVKLTRTRVCTMFYNLSAIDVLYTFIPYSGSMSKSLGTLKTPTQGAA